VERLRAAYDYTARTGELQRERLHPEFVWDMTAFRGAILPGTYEGVDGANRFLAEWLEGFEQWSLDIEEVLDRGDRVVTVVRQRARPSEAARTWRWSLRTSGRSAVTWQCERRCTPIETKPSKPPGCGSSGLTPGGAQAAASPAVTLPPVPAVPAHLPVA
jgi:SnoaL-like domain